MKVKDEEQRTKSRFRREVAAIAVMSSVLSMLQIGRAHV